jgi:hypothetical protein
MKERHWHGFLYLLYLVSLFYSFYIGRYETVYSASVGAVLLIQIIGVAIILIHLLVSRFLPAVKFNPGGSFRFGLIFITGLQLVLIVGHRIEKYRPTYTVTIPETVAGCVYLFTTEEEVEDILVSDSGIGYMSSKGKVQWEIDRGGHDITAAFSTGYMNEIRIYEADSTLMSVYNVQCISVNDSGYYPVRSYDYTVFSCMDEEEFLHLVEEGVVDISRLRKQVWRREQKDGQWIHEHPGDKDHLP